MARGARGQAPRRKTEWGAFANEAGVVAVPRLINIVSGASNVLSNGIVVEGGTGFVDQEVTITRMIGVVSARIDVETAASVGELALGMIVARSEAITAGVAALPDPIDNPGASWLFWYSTQLRRMNLDNDDGGLATIRMPFDVKGQRVLRAGSTTVWIASAQNVNMEVGVAGRVLVKLT